MTNSNSWLVRLVGSGFTENGGNAVVIAQFSQGQGSLTTDHSALFTSASAPSRACTTSKCPALGGPVQWSPDHHYRPCSHLPPRPAEPAPPPSAHSRRPSTVESNHLLSGLVHICLRAQQSLHHIQVPLLGGPVQWSPTTIYRPCSHLPPRPAEHAPPPSAPSREAQYSGV
jgi:endogenous inhibitor of DNA gyrase (YacG/DUF329 family)